jgi:excisionase family DNA binding protein
MTTVDQAPLAPGRAPLLSVKGAAAILDVSVSTIRRLERAGKLRSLRVGVQLRFEQEELERYAAAQGDKSRGVTVASEATEVPSWAEEKVRRWRQDLEGLLPEPAKSQVVVIDRRGAKAFSMLRPTGFQWGVNLWHSTALCLQSDAELRERFGNQEVFVFEEMVQRGRDVEGVRQRLEAIGLEAKSIALIRQRAKFLEGKVADPHLLPIEDLDEQDYPEAAAFISRLFDYCEPPLDPDHILATGDLEEPLTAEDVRERLRDSGLVGVVWNRQSIDDSKVAAVTIDRPQFFDTAAVSLPEGFVARWFGPCKIRIYLSADGRRVTLSFITFPTLHGDRAGWERLIDRTWERYGAEERVPDPEAPSTEELERAYVDVCTDLSVDLLRQAVLAGIPDTLGMRDVKSPRQGELNAFFGTKRGVEMHKQIKDALKGETAPKLRLPPRRPVPLFVDADRSMSIATDPEHAQSCIVRVLPSKHAVREPGEEPPDSVKGIGYLELLKKLRPLEETALSNGLDGLLDGVRAKPVNVVEEDEGGWTVMRGFIGSELGEDGPYDAREMRRTQAISLAALHQWLRRLGRENETEIHVAKLLVNLVHDWGGGTRELAIEPYPYKHGYMPGVDSKVPWRSEKPKYFLRELADGGLVARQRKGPSYRYSLPPGFDLEKFVEKAELSGHERSQLKSLVRAYALVQERCKVNRRRDPDNPALTREFSDPLIVLSSARNEQIAYTCALFEIRDWVEIGRQLFEGLNVHGAVDKNAPHYRKALDARVVPFAQAARFLFEKISMYEAVPELRQQLAELFEKEGVDAGDILLETIDREARFAESYQASKHPVGLLKTAVPVLRSFSSMIRQALCELGLQEDTRSEEARTIEFEDGRKVTKNLDYYAERVVRATDPKVGAAVRRAAEAVRAAGDPAGEAEAVELLDAAFELIVAELESQIQQGADFEFERRRKDNRHSDLIDIARQLESNSHVRGAEAVVAVGDFYNFMNVVGKAAEVTERSDTEVAAGLQERMRETVERATEEGNVVAHISGDNCVLAADDADELLSAVEAVNEAFRVELEWERGIVDLAYMRFGIDGLEHGAFLDSLVRAMKLADKAGFQRGTVALTPLAHGRLGEGNGSRCACEKDANGAEVYCLDDEKAGEE